MKKIETLKSLVGTKAPEATCPACGGEGYLEVIVPGGWYGPRYNTEECPMCYGRGSLDAPEVLGALNGVGRNLNGKLEFEAGYSFDFDCLANAVVELASTQPEPLYRAIGRLLAAHYPGEELDRGVALDLAEAIGQEALGVDPRYAADFWSRATTVARRVAT